MPLTDHKLVITMSSAGACPRVLTAMNLGYEKIARPQSDQEKLDYYTSLEDVCAAQMTFVLSRPLISGGYCKKCDRHGIHIEISEDDFFSPGHLDRRVILAGKKYPIEIKTLGRFTYDQFKKSGFAAVPEYEGQELMYLEHDGSPGLYWILNRDTGETTRLIINDFNNEIDLSPELGFRRITLARTYEDLKETLMDVAMHVSAGVLYDNVIYDPNVRACKYCDYRYLCTDVPEEEEAPTVIEDVDIAMVAKQWAEAENQRVDALAIQKDCALDFLRHAKNEDQPRFQVLDVVFKYSGLTTKNTLDKKALVAAGVSQELINKCTKAGKPFDSFTVKFAKGSTNTDEES